MIKTIYLHIGLHKTGTSTIQQTFGEIRQKLAQNGFLYPAFVMKERERFNHSIPMMSMFCGEPEKYWINIKYGCTTKEAVEKLNQSYDRQLKEQILNFGGHTLIISGEDISRLTIPQLAKLRQYLINITNPEVSIKILMVIRHPVSWEISGLQEMIKSGKSLKSSIETNATQKTHKFISETQKFKIVFQQDSLLIQRYEELSENANGLFAGFIREFHILEKEIEYVENKRINQSITHEGAAMLNAVHENFPFYENSELATLLRKFNAGLFTNMSGVRFQISEEGCLDIWSRHHKSINNLCRKYGLPTYTYRCTFVNNDTEKWGDAVTGYLAGIIPKLPDEIIPAVLGTLLSEMKEYGKSWPLKKKLHIFALFMFFSKYFQTDSVQKKANIIVNKTGLFNGLVLMTGYIIFKARLIKTYMDRMKTQ